MEYQNLLVELKNRILYITINRETKLNALNRATLLELNSAFSEAENNKEIRGVLLTGAGTKAFVAGADISEFSDFNAEEGKALSKNGHDEVFNKIENLKKPVIAAINGFALGGGLELVMACHIRIASENAKMGLPEVSLGLIPGYGGTQRLSRLVGKGKAFEMILTADMQTAVEAEKIGLINKVVSQEDLISTAEGILNKIISRSSTAISAAIVSINASDDGNEFGFETEIKQFGWCFSQPDFKEGTQAFLEKRKPNFE